MRMTELTYSESIFVARPPAELWDMIADVTRMGEWSPICRACWWDEGGGPEVGAWFTGRNQDENAEWETRSQVVAAERGQVFAFEVNEGRVSWTFAFTPADGGTELTESWEFLPAGQAFFAERYGDAAPARTVLRTEQARAGIPATLAAIKASAEADETE
jgi:hypothetical protein